MNTALRGWTALRRLPGGPALFSWAVCRRAPYFGSISPRIVELAPGRCVVVVRKRRRVLNHIGTVHAIACCNACEVAAGLAVEAAVPPTHRWIPRGMTVAYVARATTDITATAQVDVAAAIAAAAPDGVDVDVPVIVTDTTGRTVVTATITMRVGPKPR